MGRVQTLAIALGVLVLLAALPSAAGANELKTIEVASPLVDTSEIGGTIVGGTGELEANVLLPDGYEPRRSGGYPILYLLHGASFGYAAWKETLDIENLAADFDGIIVMPEGGRFGMYIDWWNDGARGKPRWASYELKRLRSLIEQRFPIRHGRGWHAVAGLSMGGQGALRLAALAPGYFGSVAGFSAATPNIQDATTRAGFGAIVAGAGGVGVSYEDVFGPPDGFYATGNNPTALLPNLDHTRIYMSSGDGVNCPEDPINPQSIAIDIAVETYVRSAQDAFVAAAEDRGDDITAQRPCGVHTFGVWERALEDAMNDWGFFGRVEQHPRSWTYRTVRRSGPLWDLRYRMAKPVDAVLEFRRSGRTLQATGDGSVVISGPKRCELAVELPFERRLPSACS